jgi:peptide/nickel transport system substrate-binding protein
MITRGIAGWPRRWWQASRASAPWIAIMLLAAGCAPAAGPPGPQTARSESSASAPKRIVAAVVSEQKFLSQVLNPSGIRGTDALEELTNSGLTIEDHTALLVPKLAEAVPTIENGLWKVFPDGRMETTWKLREGAAWHDGVPFTAADLVFTTTVWRSRDIPGFHKQNHALIEAVEAPEPGTITVRWQKPYIEADDLFTDPPLPRHLLERSFHEDKGGFRDLPYWNVDFVGTGPFKLKEWAAGSHLILTGFDQFVLGRPKIDEIEVKMITDSNTLLANILAGTVELTLGLTLSLEQAVQIREQWRDGAVDVSVQDWVVIFPQFINANPPIITNLQFRKALLHAINRQEMAETIQFGLVPVAHAIVYPDTAEYRAIEQSIVRYDYDPGRASQMVEALGYARGLDGILRDSAGQRLSVETNWSQVLDINTKSVHPVADYWQRIGVGVDLAPIPAARADDREFRATFPGVALQRQPGGLRSLERYHGAEARLPERNFTGNNNARYINPEFDGALDRYFSTIPEPDRMRALGQVVRHMTDQLIVLPLFYDTKSSMRSNRLRNVTGLGDESTQAWNAHLWEKQ